MAPLPLATGTITASAPASTITLAPRFDIGGVFETVKGGVKTAVNAASDGVDQAKDGIDAINALQTTAQEVENFKQSMDKIFALWTQYKPLFNAAGIGLAFVVILCQIACCIQWMQNCCCCVMFGIRLSNASCRCCCCMQHACVAGARVLGRGCQSTSGCVPGIAHALDNAHRLRKDYDGCDPTWIYRAATGHGIPADMKAVAHFKWFGPTQSWFGRNIARLWNGHQSRVVRDWAAEQGRSLKAERKIIGSKSAVIGRIVQKKWDEKGELLVSVIDKEFKEKLKSYSWLDELWDRIYHGVKAQTNLDWIRIRKKDQRKIEKQEELRGYVEPKTELLNKEQQELAEKSKLKEYKDE